jgi:hypothetical protein
MKFGDFLTGYDIYPHETKIITIATDGLFTDANLLAICLVGLDEESDPEFVFVRGGNVVATQAYTKIPIELYQRTAVEHEDAFKFYCESTENTKQLVGHNASGFVSNFLDWWFFNTLAGRLEGTSVTHNDLVTAADKTIIDTLPMSRVAMTKSLAPLKEAYSFEHYQNDLFRRLYNKKFSYTLESVTEHYKCMKDPAGYKDCLMNPLINAMRTRDLYLYLLDRDL